MQIIKEAFIAFGYCGLKITQVLEVTVEINAELYDREGGKSRMALTVGNILEFIDNWRIENGLLDDVKLKDSQIAKFASDLHQEIKKWIFRYQKGL